MPNTGINNTMKLREVKKDIKSFFDFFLFAVGLRDFSYKRKSKEGEEKVN